jgi:hypothetical protein
MFPLSITSRGLRRTKWDLLSYRKAIHSRQSSLLRYNFPPLAFHILFLATTGYNGPDGKIVGESAAPDLQRLSSLVKKLLKLK